MRLERILACALFAVAAAAPAFEQIAAVGPPGDGGTAGFGQAVALSADGRVLAAGAFDERGADYTGAIYVFERPAGSAAGGASWAAPVRLTGCSFPLCAAKRIGAPLALAPGGNVIVVGNVDDGYALYAFFRLVAAASASGGGAGSAWAPAPTLLRCIGSVTGAAFGPLAAGAALLAVATYVPSTVQLFDCSRGGACAGAAPPAQMPPGAAGCDATLSGPVWSPQSGDLLAVGAPCAGSAMPRQGRAHILDATRNASLVQTLEDATTRQFGFGAVVGFLNDTLLAVQRFGDAPSQLAPQYLFAPSSANGSSWAQAGSFESGCFSGTGVALAAPMHGAFFAVPQFSGFGNVVAIFDAAGGSAAQTLQPQDAAGAATVRSLAFDADGDLLVIGGARSDSAAGAAIVFGRASPSPSASLTPSPSASQSLTASPSLSRTPAPQGGGGGAPDASAASAAPNQPTLTIALSVAVAGLGACVLALAAERRCSASQRRADAFGSVQWGETRVGEA
jgi:hypothetical protein